MNLKVAWSVLAVVVVVAVVVAATQGGEGGTAERVRHLSEQIQCPECDGVSVAQSLSPTSRAIRQDLRRRVEARQTDDEIRAAYAEQYGEAILLEPGGGGLGVLVWGLPVVLLVAGAGALVYTARRRRDEPLLHATDADEKLVESTRRPEPS